MQFTHGTLIATSETGETMIGISDDVLHRPPFANKRAMEFSHLQHFKRLVKKQVPSLMFRTLRDGQDPPDFIIERDETAIGLELTVLTWAERRKQVAFFSELRGRLLRLHSKGRLRRLAGLHIEVSYGELGGRPFDISDEDLLALVEAFEAINDQPWTDPAQWDVDDPPRYPLGAYGKIAGGLVTWEVSGISNVPCVGSSFADATGFEISHTYRANVTADEIHKQIEALVQRKDRESNQELLIAVSAPGLDGRAFPGEGVATAVALERWRGLRNAPRYLHRVFLDSWSTDKVFVLYDDSAS